MELSIGFSPCPNDTFIFDALIHQKIDSEGLSFDVQYQDVESLNQMAFEQKLDITKLSYHAFAYASEHYELLDAGSALGFGVGPLLITKDQALAERLADAARNTTNADTDGADASLADLRIGIPGKFTTANFLLGLAYPSLQNKVELVFSNIEDAVLRGEVDAGLIIHENRFTYADRGLFKAQDLGEFWEKGTGFPIPLGGIVIRRSLPQEVKELVNRLIAESVRFAFANPKSSASYVREHAQEMEEEVMYKHIELYVNTYSENLGETGRKAVNYMFDEAERLGLVPKRTGSLFLQDHSF